MISKANHPRLFTIGYEQATSAAVLDELVRAGVQLLVDVRAVAASRRPGFSKRQLAAGLDERGIAYLHLRALGTPKEGREAARAGRIDELNSVYDSHLTTEGARDALAELTAIVKSDQNVCLLCYEREPAQCHRNRISTLMHERTGAHVENLFAPLF